MVVGEHTNAAQSGKFIEIVGVYDPKAGSFEVNDERVKYWISKGAKPSGTVHNFLVDKKIIDGKKINVLPKKTKQIKETPEAEKPKEAAPAAEAPAETPAETPEAPEAPAEEAAKEETPA